jgi:DNA-binding NtrC family response regulator
LLLDEISELAPALQAKLLRVLQEGEFERVGSSTTRRADVRVIATTNRDLEAWVAKKRFREDLYYRLNVLPVCVPPLRERSDDLLELAEYFVERATSAHGCGPKTFSRSALEAMMEYDWPGNIRELENICCRAVTLCGGGEIGADLLGPWLRAKTGRVLEGLSSLREGQLLQDMERQLIERTLQRFNGHRAKSAKALGMGVRTLGMKLKQWREEAESARRNMVAVGAGV